MDLLLRLLILLLITSLMISSSTLNSAAAAASSSQPRALVAPITKDSLTSLYTLSLISSNNKKQQLYLVDLTGPLLWSPCPAHHHHPTISCNSTTCAIANSLYGPFDPHQTCHGRHHKSSSCICTTSAVNPITNSCGSADLTLTTLTLSSTTDGRMYPVTLPDFISSCAPRFLLRSLPAASAGVAGLSRSPLALHTQLSFSLSLKSQLAICLPSTATASAEGVALIGDVDKHLFNLLISYTPLLKNPFVNSNYYYIKLCGIAVNGEPVPFLGRVLEFDSLGHGGVQLSTTIPYTSMRSHIYRPFLCAFARATRGIPRAPRVKPFDLCLKYYRAVGGINNVPRIDLMLPGGKNWTVLGANSMKQVSEDVACLAFVDGGMRAEQAVVIGGFQMEENLLVFDEARSRVGFSSSLFTIGTTCANFKFTSGL